MNETISKRILAERLAAKRGINTLDALDIVRDVSDFMADELAKGHRLEFRDFGVLQVVWRKPRPAHNPKTLQKVQVPGRWVVRFKPGRKLKAAVRALPPPKEGDDAASPGTSTAS